MSIREWSVNVRQNRVWVRCMEVVHVRMSDVRCLGKKRKSECVDRVCEMVNGGLSEKRFFLERIMSEKKMRMIKGKFFTIFNGRLSELPHQST